MPRSKSSQQWLKAHFSDPYVQRANQAGLRSRAAYKLLEIQARDKLMTRGATVIDLGAAPGGWSQVAAQCVGEQGRVFAIDLLPMLPVMGVEFIQGDFSDDAVLQHIKDNLALLRVDLVLSDMAPNMSGMKAIDQPRALYLAKLALLFAQDVLKPGGSLLIKLFQGAGFDTYKQQVAAQFTRVVVRKPAASRASSRELYLLAQGCKKTD